MNGHIARQWFEPVPGTMLLLHEDLPEEKKKAAKEAWDKLPPVTQSVFYHCATDIIVENESAQNDAYGEITARQAVSLKTKNGKRALTNPLGVIHIYAKDVSAEAMKGTMLHECGHSFDFQAYKEAYGMDFSDTPQWKEAYKKENEAFADLDGSTRRNVWINEEEGFAEIYRLLREGNKKIKELVPECVSLAQEAIKICEERYKSCGLLVSKEDIKRERRGNDIGWEYPDDEKQAIRGIQKLVEDVRDEKETDPGRIADRFNECRDGLNGVQNTNRRCAETFYVAVQYLKNFTEGVSETEAAFKGVQFCFNKKQQEFPRLYRRRDELPIKNRGIFFMNTYMQPSLGLRRMQRF